MTIKNYHFIGLGGIGMSALARVLLQQGHRVQGSDAVNSPLLNQLKEEGATIQVGHDPDILQTEATVIYSSDIKESNAEVQKAKELQLPLMHRADLLGDLLKEKKGLLVTGTHGKTTTSSLLAAVLIEARLDPSFVIGGILQSHGTNGRFGQGPHFVAEADESDGSFLKMKGWGAIVTNLENEHLNYWETPEKLDAGFSAFCAQIKESEHLFWCGDDPRLCALHLAGVSYGFSEKAELKISDFRSTDTGISFQLSFRGKEYREIHLSLLGRHNALNAAAVFGLCLSLKIPESSIRSAFEHFQGIARRLEKRGEAHRVILYDDYGHHPTEIAATLQALREQIREKRMVVVFQPHRYTRVRDLFVDFLQCFGAADEVVLTDIYSAGEPPIEGVTSAQLYTQLREKLGAKLHFFPRQHLESGVASLLKPFDVLLTIGAGDVTRAGEPILRLYAERAPKLKVALLCGGTSAEHPVSLSSTRQILQTLDLSIYDYKLFGITKEGWWLCGPDTIEKLEQKVCLSTDTPKLSASVLQELTSVDVCIPVLHGPQAEDGMIQGLLDTLQIPYAGCPYQSSAICMQKTWAKHIAFLNQIPTPPYFEFTVQEYRKDPTLLKKKIAENLRYPVWVKPVHLGSSIGVARANSPEEIAACAETAFHYDDTILIEQHVEGRQVEFSLLGNEYIRIALPGEVLTGGAFLDYEGKYGVNASPIQVPPNMSLTHQKIGQELAERVYRSLGCKGLARIDFFYDHNGHYWFNEINPFPGFTPTSAFPQAWAASGLSRAQINDELVILALQRSRRLAEIRGH